MIQLNYQKMLYIIQNFKIDNNNQKLIKKLIIYGDLLNLKIFLQTKENYQKTLMYQKNNKYKMKIMQFLQDLMKDNFI